MNFYRTPSKIYFYLTQTPTLTKSTYQTLPEKLLHCGLDSGLFTPRLVCISSPFPYGPSPGSVLFPGLHPSRTVTVPGLSWYPTFIVSSSHQLYSRPFIGPRSPSSCLQRELKGRTVHLFRSGGPTTLIFTHFHPYSNL